MSVCSNKWPTLLDYNRDDCKRMLRSLELEAYASLVTAFRAQGDLNKDKRKMLQDLQSALSISTERHRAEIRRATNDEKLTTIADNMAGPDVSSEWQIEGRRLIPLMPRLVPQTAFTVAANNAANVQAEKNAFMPSPSLTANAEANVSNSEIIPTTPVSNKLNRPTSPTSSVVVLPSGMSIHIKGGLNTEEEDIHGKRRRRSSSAESIVMTRTTPIITTVTSASKMSSIAAASGSNSIQGITPMKISVTKSPVKSHNTTVTPAQKVIIVSSSASGTAGSNIIQKSVHIPIVKTGITTTVTSSTASQPRSSIVVPSSAMSLGPPMNAPLQAGASYMTTPKPRLKQITTRPKTPQITGRSGIMLPVGAQSVQGGTPAMQNIQIKPVNKPTIHIKQEGSMKIITQGMPGGTSKILPKPSGAPVVVVTTVPSSSHIAKSIAAAGGPAGKVLNFSTAGGRLIAATARGTTANVVTVNPKTLQLTTVRGAGGATVLTGSRIATPTGAKPNVIVVQKAQSKRAQTPTTPTTIHIAKSSASSSPFEKELVSFIQKQDTHTKQVPGQPQKFSIQKGGQKQTVEVTKRPIVVRQHSGVEVVQKAPSTPGVAVTSSAAGKGSSLLAELIQAVGIGPDNVQTQEEVVFTEETSAVASITVDSQKDQSQNQWVEYDMETAPEPVVQEVTTTTNQVVGDQIEADSTDASAIKALLDLQSNAPPKTSRPSTLEIPQGTTEGQSDYLTLEQVQSMIASQTVTVQPVGSNPVSMEEVQPSTSGMEVQISEAQPVEASVQQEVGELDPETGLFYSSPASTPAVTVTSAPRPHVETIVVSRPVQPVVVNENVISVSKAEPVPPKKIPETIVSATELMDNSVKRDMAPKQIDFLSSALNQAQIDLDPYQFIEEDEPAPFPTKLPPQNQTVSVAETAPSENQGSLVSILTPQSSLANSQTTFSTLSANTASQESQVIVASSQPSQAAVNADSTFLPEVLPSVPSSSGASSSQVVTVQSPVTAQSKSFIPIQDVLRKRPGTISVVPQSTTNTQTTNVAVTVEPMGATGLDTTHMKIEDFTSQRYTEQSESELPNEDTSPFGSPSSINANSSIADLQDPQSMRLSKRKRKPPPTPDEITMQSSVGGWVRLALGLLQRVCRFRGSYKEKGEMNAASWFTRPVDPNEVPDYYSIIKHPMDFGTIKKKLEAGQYHDWEDFHADMVLVKQNCLQYNPIGTDVRRDCEEVFNFYTQEYEKALIKWQQTHIASSPVGKKLKLSTSPVRSNMP